MRFATLAPLAHERMRPLAAASRGHAASRDGIAAATATPGGVYRSLHGRKALATLKKGRSLWDRPFLQSTLFQHACRRLQ